MSARCTARIHHCIGTKYTEADECEWVDDHFCELDDEDATEPGGGWQLTTHEPENGEIMNQLHGLAQGRIYGKISLSPMKKAMWMPSCAGSQDGYQ